MIYPEFIKKGDVAGITAVSDGVSDELDKKRFYNGQNNFREKGIDVLFTDNVFRTEQYGKSSSGEERWKQYKELLENKDVTCIISAKGGNFLNEMMKYVQYDVIRDNPKWFQGYSDNTWLVNSITTKCDIATIYGNNYGDFGMNNWHPSVTANYEILSGRRKTQDSFDMYQDGFRERITGLEGYVDEKESIWKCVYPGEDKVHTGSVSMRGRMLGGCLDVLMSIHGTKYDNVNAFIQKYKDDGIIWYMETFASDSENLMMNLWKLKESGWFMHTKGIVLGRPLFFTNGLFETYEETVLYIMKELNIPIIFDSDIGHKGPRMTIVNGAVATVSCDNGKGHISYEYV